MLFVFLASCIKEEPRFTLPFSVVRFEIDLNGVDSDLQPSLNKVFTKPRSRNEAVGYGGLLIYRSYDNSIYAYDLSCPYEEDQSVLVTPLDNGKAFCEKCESTYITMYGLGTPESGPSKESLQKYNVVPIAHRAGAFYIRN